MTHFLSLVSGAALRAAKPLLCGALIAFAAAGCSRLSAPSVDLRKITLQVADRANGNAPVAVDLVLISDEKLIDPLLALPAADWFAKRDQMALDHKEALQVTSWELTPGQTTPSQEIERKNRVYAAVVYAQYATPGPHRLRLTEEADVKILLGERTLSIAPPPAK